jgi:hypothetical protein
MRVEAWMQTRIVKGSRQASRSDSDEWRQNVSRLQTSKANFSEPSTDAMRLAEVMRDKKRMAFLDSASI